MYLFHNLFFRAVSVCTSVAVSLPTQMFKLKLIEWMIDWFIDVCHSQKVKLDYSHHFYNKVNHNSLT